DVGGEDQDGEDQTQHIDEQMTFPARDLLSSIIATRAAHLGGLDRLAIDDRCSRFRVAPGALPNSATQCIIDPLPCAILLPCGKIVIDQLPRWEVMGQHSPLATAPEYVENGVDDFPSRVLDRLRSRLGGWNQWLQDLPLLVGQVGRIWFPASRFSALRIHAPEPWADPQ